MPRSHERASAAAYFGEQYSRLTNATPLVQGDLA